MEENIVRLIHLEINNIKNVNHGNIDLVSKDTDKRGGSVLGIYGQNGSGKTVVVDVMLLLKCLISGKMIPSHFYQYIRYQSETASVKYCFLIKKNSERFYVEYEIELLKTDDKQFVLNMEKLSSKIYINEKRTKLTPVFEYHRDRKELFSPLKYSQSLSKNIDAMVALGVARQLSENFNEEKQRSEISSFLFSKKAQDIFSDIHGEGEKIYQYSNILQRYGIKELAVVENSHYGLLALNINTLPMNIDWPSSIKGKAMSIMVNLTGINIVPKIVFPYFEKTIEQINIVMKSMVSEITLEIYNAFDKLMDDGQDGVQFEIITIRNGARIPLLFESAGIKKIISICSNLIACYNKESYCLVIDELDSGIYEYLLGECLEAMQEKAKGQLIFTSHNLRPLEVLDNDSLVFTTVNPEERYLKTSYIKNTQNTRLSYLRAIKLGGQKEKLYNVTNIYEIEMAMRKAGRVGVNE